MQSNRNISGSLLEIFSKGLVLSQSLYTVSFVRLAFDNRQSIWRQITGFVQLQTLELADLVLIDRTDAPERFRRRCTDQESAGSACYRIQRLCRSLTTESVVTDVGQDEVVYIFPIMARFNCYNFEVSKAFKIAGIAGSGIAS
ncbi:MAG: hypothetical protein ABI197_13175 [Granulicella sp.]